MKDYYSVLGLSKNASDAEIKTAYRKKALEWHPDRNKAPEAHERFKEINKAYEVLSNPQKKQMYDQYGHDAFERGGGNSAAGGAYQQGPFSYYTNFGGQNVDFDFGGMDPFDIFEQFFGARSPFGSSGRSHKRRDVYQVELTFDEAVKGVEKETVINGKQKSIKIPAGVDNGMTIRFSDFDVQVRVKPHAFFKREDQDIYYEKDISFPQAVMGTVVEVPTIDASVKLKVRPGTPSGTTVRLKGQGVPYPNTNQRGDQYVIFKVQVPQKVSGKAKKLLEELEKELH
jgi:DnaJ-class molecular chaperone